MNKFQTSTIYIYCIKINKMFFILLQIVDIGSGKGYLGQYLTSNYNIDVLGIEMNFGCTSSAEMMSSKMKTAHNTNIYDRYKTVTY